MTDLEKFIVSLPKAEVHLHLEGSVDLETLRELAARHSLPPPPAELYHFRDFPGFLVAFKTVCQYLRSPEDYELITRRLVRRLQAAGVSYAEIYLAAGVLLWQNRPLEELFEGARTGCRRGQQGGEIEVRWIFDATRQFGPEAAMQMARRAARLRERGVVAIGIGGDETQAPPELFREVYAYARSEGLRLTAHAGETAGPESVWGALRAPGSRAHRPRPQCHPRPPIGGLPGREASPRGCVPVQQPAHRHPGEPPTDTRFAASLTQERWSRFPPTIRRMFETDLVREYALAHDALGFSRDELRRLAENSFRAAFTP